jgi:hypothetical protein
VHLETDQEASRLSQLIGKMQHTEHKFDQESGNSHTSSIADKLHPTNKELVLFGQVFQGQHRK